MKRINFYTFEESSLLPHNATGHLFLKMGVVKNGSHHFQAWISAMCTNTQSRKSSRCLKPEHGNTSVWAEMQNLNTKVWTLQLITQTGLVLKYLYFLKYTFLQTTLYCFHLLCRNISLTQHYWNFTWEDNREFRNRRKSRHLWCLSSTDLFQLCYTDCKYCFIWFP